MFFYLFLNSKIFSHYDFLSLHSTLKSHLSFTLGGWWQKTKFIYSEYEPLFVD